MARDAVAGAWGIDTQDFLEFARRQMKAAEVTPTLLSRNLRAAAGPIAATAKSLASWSSRIPGSIRIAGGVGGVVVKAGGEKAPHARPYEMGSKGNQGEVRHPVFGNTEVWTAKNTPTKPYLRPAALANRAVVQKAAESAVSAALREAGFYNTGS